MTHTKSDSLPDKRGIRNQQMAGKRETCKGGGGSETCIRLKAGGNYVQYMGQMTADVLMCCDWGYCWCTGGGVTPTWFFLLAPHGWCLMKAGWVWWKEGKKEGERIRGGKEPLMSWPEAYTPAERLNCCLNRVTNAVREAVQRKERPWYMTSDRKVSSPPGRVWIYCGLAQCSDVFRNLAPAWSWICYFYSQCWWKKTADVTDCLVFSRWFFIYLCAFNICQTRSPRTSAQVLSFD